jgi:hypothetical protein
LGKPVNFPTEGQEQALKRGGSSKYRGVSKNGKNWKATIRIDKKQIYLGTFDSEEAAARKIDEATKDGEVQAVKKGSSRYRGVSKSGKNWKATIRIDKKQIYLGTFGSEEAAARKIDEAAKDGEEQAVKKGSSRFRGVSKSGEKWRAGIRIDKKQIYLGTFDSEEAAAHKFDETSAPLGRTVNFPLSMENAGADMAV